MPGIVFLVFRFLLLLALFAFILLMIYLLWRDLRQQTTNLSDRRIPPILLEFRRHQDRKQTIFSHPQVSIGRSFTCDYILEEDTISAMHARLSYRHSQWWIEDLNSTNGTFINDQRISQPVVVARNDCIRLGDVEFFVDIDEP